ncbi:MAG: hypothetical protein HC805_08630 [Alkalinema sp. RL_2_19]|nr:hypothetical protein [Alkalinema sp. RL_2_19]
MTNITVFGQRPRTGIFQPPAAFAVRNDCKVGVWKIGDKQRLNGQVMQMSILRVHQMFGTLGNTQDAIWLQVWFVAGPDCEVNVPKNTVCMTYVKKQSLDNLYATVVQAMSGKDPGVGIFEARFSERSGNYGTYYVLDWTWREREDGAEVAQLEDIAAFLATEPAFFDQATSANLRCIDGWDSDQIQELIANAQTDRRLAAEREAALKQAA